MTSAQVDIPAFVVHITLTVHWCTVCTFCINFLHRLIIIYISVMSHFRLAVDPWVGRDGEAWGEVIERHGEETKNRNEQRLLSVCVANELVILNTFFQHKDIHKYTWESRGRGL